MNLYTLVRILKFSLLAYLAITHGGQSLVYANIDATNQCAKLFEVQKKIQIPSFKDVVNKGVREQQLAQAKALAEHREAEMKRSIEEERQKREASDPLLLSRKIRFIKIHSENVQNSNSNNSTKNSNKESSEIMDSKMTQMMYAQLMMLFGISDPKVLFPSKFNLAVNKSENYHGIQIVKDAAVNNISAKELNNVLLVGLNCLSYSDDPTVIERLKFLIPSFERFDQFRLPNGMDYKSILSNSQNHEGLSPDQIILDGNISVIKKYTVDPENFNTLIPMISETDFEPLYLDGQPIFLGGHEMELTEDRFYSDKLRSFFMDGKIRGGEDLVAVRAGLWEHQRVRLWSSFAPQIDIKHKAFNIGFRLVRSSRGFNGQSEFVKSEYREIFMKRVLEKAIRHSSEGSGQ